jgi:hypothetical protein
MYLLLWAKTVPLPLSLLLLRTFADRVTYQHVFFLSLSYPKCPKWLCLCRNCPSLLLPALAHRRRALALLRLSPSGVSCPRARSSPAWGCSSEIRSRELEVVPEPGAWLHGCALPTGSTPTSLIASPNLPADWDDDASSPSSCGSPRRATRTEKVTCCMNEGHLDPRCKSPFEIE